MEYNTQFKNESNKKSVADNSKPYGRSRSILSSVKSTVKDYLSPTWLVDLVGNVKKKNVQDDATRDQRIHRPADHYEFDVNHQAVSKPNHAPVNSSLHHQLHAVATSTQQFSGNNQPVRVIHPPGNTTHPQVSTAAPVYTSINSNIDGSSYQNERVSTTSTYQGGFESPQQPFNPSLHGSPSSHQQVFITSSNISTVPNNSVNDSSNFCAMRQSFNSGGTATVTPPNFISHNVSNLNNNVVANDHQMPIASVKHQPLLGDMSLPSAPHHLPSSKSGNFLWSESQSDTQPQPSVKPNCPAFNVSAFNTSHCGTPEIPVSSASPLFGSNYQRSPFYPGKTCYGGASSHSRRHRLNSSLPYEATGPARVQVKAKSLNHSISSASGVSSSTAKKILDTLEKMSTPLSDAKKIPKFDTSYLESPVNVTPTSYKKRNLSFSDATRGLSVPSVPPKSKLNTPVIGSICPNIQPPASNQTKNSEIPLSSSLNKEHNAASVLSDNSKSTGGKMRRERNIHHTSRKTQQSSDELESPELPTQVTLQIDSMPAFNFSCSTSITTTSSAKSVCTTSSTTLSTHTSTTPESSNSSYSSFMFDSPVSSHQQHTVNSLISVSPMEFKFSSPIFPSSSSSQNNKMLSELSKSTSEFMTSTKASSVPSSFPNFAPVVSSPSQSVKKPVIPSEMSKEPLGFGGIQAAKELKSGSVMDILGGNKAQPSLSKSEPSTKPMVKQSPNNKPPNKKSATISAPVIEADESSLKPSLKIDLKSLIQKNKNEWNCCVCMVPNKEENEKCVACSAENPKKLKPLVATKIAGNWTCSVCMVSNKADSTKCVACETPNPAVANTKSLLNGPSSLPSLNQLAKKSGANSWECDTCMVRNKPDSIKCVACETPKIGSSKVSGFESGGGFKVPSQTNLTLQDSGGFKIQGFLTTTTVTSSITSNPTGGFKFGDEKQLSGGFKLSSTVKTTTTGFSLTTTPSTISATEEPKQSAAAEGLMTGGFKLPKVSQSSTPVKSPQTSDNQTLQGFKFGQSKSPLKTIESTSNVSALTKDSVPSSSASTGFKFGSSNSTVSTSSVSFTGGFKFGSLSSSSSTLTLSTSTCLTSNSNSEPASIVSTKTSLHSDLNLLPSSTGAQSLPESSNKNNVMSSSLATVQSFSSLTKPQSPDTKTTSSGLFSLNTPSSLSSSVALGTFTFGSSSSTALSTVSQPESTIMKPATTAAAPVFGMAGSTAESKPNAGVFQFGGSSANPSKPSSGFSFNTPSTTTPSSTSLFLTNGMLPSQGSEGKSLFTFGSAASPATNSLSKSEDKSMKRSREANEDPSAPKSLFRFGGSSANEFTPVASSAASTTPVFGQVLSTKTTTVPTFNFNANTTNLSSKPSNNTFLFGQASNNSQNGFGVPAASSATFTFGAVSSTNSAFGGSSISNSTEFNLNPRPTFNFGEQPSTVAENKINAAASDSQSLFTFGASQQQPFAANKPGLFQFGQNTTPAQPQQAVAAAAFKFEPQPFSQPSMAMASPATFQPTGTPNPASSNPFSVQATPNTNARRPIKKAVRKLARK